MLTDKCSALYRMFSLLVTLVLALGTPVSETVGQQTTAAAAVTTDTAESLLTFTPPDYSVFIMHSKVDVIINVSTTLYDYASYYRGKGSSFYMGVKFDRSNQYLAAMIKVKRLSNVLYTWPKSFNLSYLLLLPLQIENEANNALYLTASDSVNVNGLQLHIDSIGYPSIEIEVIELDMLNKTSIIHEQSYHMRIIRNYRTVDLGFTLVITIVALMNTFAVGSMTDIAALRVHVKDSVIPMCIAAGTQYIAVPVLAFSVMKIGQSLPEFAVGVLICACVPGCGLGHLIVVITGTANCELSVAINCLHIFLTLGTAPLWLVSLGQFLPNGNGETEIPISLIVICLAIMVIPYALGVILKRFQPSVADTILNWLVKPMLLLFMILFVTLGLYINMYAVGVLDKLTMAMAGMVPSLGFCIGGGFTLLARQHKPEAKSVAIEASITNCLAVIAIIKHTMPQPDADMAIAGVMAVMFCLPVPFIGMLVFHKIKRKVMAYLENRKFEKEQQETILKSFAVITQNALQISGMTPHQVAERHTDDNSNVDNTIPDCYEDYEQQHQSVVQLQNDSTVETVPLTETNHRNYV